MCVRIFLTYMAFKAFGGRWQILHKNTVETLVVYCPINLMGWALDGYAELSKTGEGVSLPPKGMTKEGQFKMQIGLLNGLMFGMRCLFRTVIVLAELGEESAIA